MKLNKSKKAISVLISILISVFCLFPLLLTSCDLKGNASAKKEPDRPDKYYYSQLDDEQKNFYNFLYNMKPGDEDIIITLKTPLEFESETSEPKEEEKQDLMDEIKRISQGAIDAFSTDNPEIFWIDFSRSYTNVEFYGKGKISGYKWTVSEIKFNICIKEQFRDDLDRYINNLQNAIDLFKIEGETTYEKVKYIHDYICSTTESDPGAENQYSIYGALVDGRSVCQGYAQAFKALCDKAGITSICIVGTAQDENHMWNYVKMDDGKWYAVDTTWDDRDPIRYTYLLVGKDTETDKDKGKTFSQTHLCTGDISRTGITEFTLPDLSTEAFETNASSVK